MNTVPEALSAESPVTGLLRFGISTPGGALAAAERDVTADAVGVPPEAVLWFTDFAAAAPVAEIGALTAAGVTPIVTWEPWRALGAGRYDRAAFPLAAIAAGAHDDHVRGWARALAPYRVGLRFAHEFNGDWYPWSGAPEVYVAAWRRLHALFAAEEAAVWWIWAPNAPFERVPLEWYPGDGYVDVLGVDGYNWGTSQPWSRWVEPDELFGPALAALGGLGKPILVTEVGCAEAGGDKPAWITALVALLAADPAVTGFVWFDHDKETDWRLTSSPESARALRGALR
ncbi:glycoside hydrolase family 26 protein [Nocardia sp. NPDC057353]|uniref:glycoside hydrolase family 26 protein n=1 Tax=Nocardia sp. NPDC057353 TaxID=3346104 RepID=UPI00363477F6